MSGESLSSMVALEGWLPSRSVEIHGFQAPTFRRHVDWLSIAAGASSSPSFQRRHSTGRVYRWKSSFRPLVFAIS